VAGTHQIWVLDLARGTIAPYAGTGREALADGPRDRACFARPSGLSLDPTGARLFVADSASSAVRQIDLQTGEVTTLVGAGRSVCGDVDGPAGLARLRRPLGVCFWPDDPQGPSVLVADTDNHRLKRLDLARREVHTLLGAGAPGGFAGGAGSGARFSAPGGLAVARGKLFVADTNNHRVRVIDLASGEAGTLEIDPSRRAHDPPDER
jgi:DNA-binding beta-propeller fold protein YncE